MGKSWHHVNHIYSISPLWCGQSTLFGEEVKSETGSLSVTVLIHFPLWSIFRSITATGCGTCTISVLQTLSITSIYYRWAVIFSQNAKWHRSESGEWVWPPAVYHDMSSYEYMGWLPFYSGLAVSGVSFLQAKCLSARQAASETLLPIDFVRQYFVWTSWFRTYPLLGLSRCLPTCPCLPPLAIQQQHISSLLGVNGADT